MTQKKHIHKTGDEQIKQRLNNLSSLYFTYLRRIISKYLMSVIPPYRAKKNPEPKLRITLGSGASWNRTNDTRIFSPLLYQLSYGTVLNRAAKVNNFLNIQTR